MQVLAVIDGVPDAPARARWITSLLPFVGLWLSAAAGAACPDVMGDWDWMTKSVVTLTADHRALYDQKPLGTWDCANGDKGVIRVRWSTGFVDSLTLSGSRLSGTNDKGVLVWGDRRQPSVVPVTVRSDSDSSDVPVVHASGILQRCLGVDTAAGRMNHGPATEPYCRQLPANDVYEQAGRLFKAGNSGGAARTVTRAAEAGNAVAQLRLALLYDQGTGVPKSSSNALRWYRRAAAQGEPESQNQVANFLELAEGIPENWPLAAKLWQASADQGWKKGQFSFGRAYQFGIGVPQDRQRAIEWFKKAAAQGYPQADYFAKWLRDPLNNIGFRNDMEHDLVIGNKLRFGGAIMGGDPAGENFRNSAQRVLWLLGQRKALDRDEAEVWWQIRSREYQDCQRTHADNCRMPGPRP